MFPISELREGLIARGKYGDKQGMEHFFLMLLIWMGSIFHRKGLFTINQKIREPRLIKNAGLNTNLCYIMERSKKKKKTHILDFSYIF